MTMPAQQILRGGSYTQGYITQVISPGETFEVYLPSGLTTVTGSISSQLINPAGAFDDFALFGLTDPDPAMTYAGWNTAGMLTGKTGYTRPWGIFYPPLDYPVSGGKLLWPRAAYMAVGFQVANIPAGQQQNLTGVQAEVMPLAGTGLDQTPAPSAYDLPRSTHVIVRPTRLNYAPNPDFAVSAAGWTLYGSATLSPTGQAVFNGPGDTIALSVPALIYGDTFTASLQAAVPAGVADVQLTVGSQTGGVPGADDSGATTFAPGTVQPQLTFTAPASTVLLSITPLLGTGGSYPVTIGLSDILIEAGQIVGSYFDGSFGSPDYMWEGTPGLSRSYWYANYKAGQSVVTDILTRQVPLSISAADPAYSTPPSQ